MTVSRKVTFDNEVLNLKKKNLSLFCNISNIHNVAKFLSVLSVSIFYFKIVNHQFEASHKSAPCGRTKLKNIQIQKKIWSYGFYSFEILQLCSGFKYQKEKMGYVDIDKERLYIL
jgi:hypothetical protein